jgi:hypothetical protein
MADVDQEQSYAAESERQKQPRQVLQLTQYSGFEEALSIPFLVKAYVDGHALMATGQTATDAFANAIEWHVLGNLTDVSISDRTRSYSIVEFASVMALAEIAHTIRTDVHATNF